MKVDLTKDASAVADTDVETIPATPADETVVEETVAESSFVEKIPEVLEGNIFAGAIGGLLSSVLGAIIWATITVVTNYQIGWVAIGLGFLVAYSIRLWGKGNTPAFGVMGVAFALFGCVLGNFFTLVGFIAQEYSLSINETLGSIDYTLMPELMMDMSSPMDFLFYAIAACSGFKYAVAV